MKIFLSYASKYRDIADDLCCRLQAVGHEVFFDREDLPAGESFDDRIRDAIESSELFIFLISPESVADGHYTRTEVKLASRKWPTPGWHVLPVQVAETPLADVPAYLRALTIMQAEGNLAAEVVIEVEDRVRANTLAPANPEPPPPEPPSASTPAGPHYRSMQLRFGRGADGRYSIAVPEAPDGGQEAAAFALDPASLEQTLWSGARQIEGSARRANPDADLEALLPAAPNAREVGQALYAALFESPLRACFEEGLRAIDPQRGEGLRFVINTTDAPDLARLPWEFLYSPAKDDFLFSDRMKPVVRWLDVDEPPPTLAVEPPLRLLMVIAAPTDRPGLEVGEEIAHLDSALAELTSSGKVEAVRLDHATLESLDNALLQSRPHILHFIGHGDFVGDEGVLVLESDTAPGTADTIAGRQLAVLLRNHLTSLRLVFLNSCMGATASRRDPFGGVAQSLIRRGIPAVIAMQFPIPDKAAVALARHFYRYLAAGQPVDAALTSARAFLYARGYPVEWGAPALHMRTPDGRLFDLAPAAPLVARMAEPSDAPPAAAAPPAPPSPQPPLATQSAPPPAAPPPLAEQAHPGAGKSGGTRGMLAAAAIGILALLAVGLWLLKGSERPADVVPAPPIPAPPSPAPAVKPEPPQPAPVVEPSPVPASRVAEALDKLHAGDSAGAAEVLQGMLNADATALTSERLGADHAVLARALGDAAEAAFKKGDTVLGYRLADLIDALGPIDPALNDHILTQLAPWLESVLAAAPAAGGMEDPLRYTVRRGDTLWDIARRLTGHGRNWPALVEHHNRRVEIGMGGRLIRDPSRIRIGDRIHVPLSNTEPDAIEYHVSQGESLSRIAWRIYGDASMWRQIHEDNRRTIPNPDLLHPGQVLLLRARSTR
ncbi:CHAT domain-containing protein [Cognatazoarcus halotolerans]|uniref:CHAT domain-containing protein n=1 Tax=Cognatazoarcus halotolerans TaxID=2686016 RepID=UPI00135B72BE|nr:CHAT domain-containing protein [Cognatazoarcus halotolerans]